MKTIDQIYRYTSDCQFSDEDWQQILDYCRKLYGGGKIHKAINPKAQSTYANFLSWLENGFGSGDMVQYGNTMGIVGYSLPDKIILAAYCDYEGNLIINEMEVLEPERLITLDWDKRQHWKSLMFEADMDFSVRAGRTVTMYTPKKYFYVTLENEDGGESGVGMYLETANCQYHFLAFLSGEELKIDYWIDCNYTPLRQATEADIKRLHTATSNAGLSYNERFHKFVKTTKRGQNNMYWYLNDRFELVMDRDDGTKKHTDRLNAGNYILDYTEGLLFMKEVRQMRGKA